MSVALHRPAEPRLWLHLIGPMRARDAQTRDLLPRTRKARAVLAILALAAPGPVSRTRITGLLWSRREREQARGSLRQCIHELQALLQPLGPGLFEADREQLRLSENAIWLDINSPGTAGAGQFLEDLSGLDPAFDEWLETERLRRGSAIQAGRISRPVRIGVRPLRILGPSDDGTIAAGLAEEIVGALARFRWIGCLPAHWPGEDPAAPEVDYVVDGTVRQAGGQMRVALRAMDLTRGGEVMWVRNFDGAPAELLGSQDEIAAQTAAQLDPELLLREGARAASRLAEAANANDLTLAAIPGLFRLKREGFEQAGKMLTRAVQLGPDYPAAHAWLAYWHVLTVGQGWRATAESATAMAQAGSLAEKAVTLDPADARALTIAGHVRAFLHRQLDDALVLHDRALALNPALPLAWMWSGLAHAYGGEHRTAIERIEMARRLSPFDPHGFFFEVALMLPHLMLGDYERAAALGRLASQLKPGFSSSWKALLSALGHLGRAAEAAGVRARLLALEPGFSVREAMERSPFLRPEDRACFAEGLRLGGLPA